MRIEHGLPSPEPPIEPVPDSPAYRDFKDSNPFKLKRKAPKAPPEHMPYALFAEYTAGVNAINIQQAQQIAALQSLVKAITQVMCAAGLEMVAKVQAEPEQAEEEVVAPGGESEIGGSS